VDWAELGWTRRRKSESTSKKRWEVSSRRGAGCYSATSPGPLVRNRDPGCYIGCYKVLLSVLHFQNRCESGMYFGVERIIWASYSQNANEGRTRKRQRTAALQNAGAMDCAPLLPRGFVVRLSSAFLTGSFWSSKENVVQEDLRRRLLMEFLPQCMGIKIPKI